MLQYNLSGHSLLGLYANSRTDMFLPCVHIACSNGIGVAFRVDMFGLCGSLLHNFHILTCINRRIERMWEGSLEQMRRRLFGAN